MNLISGTLVVTNSILATLPQKISASAVSPALAPKSAESFSFLESIISIAKKILGAFTSSHGSHGESSKTAPILKVAPKEEGSDLPEICEIEPEPKEFHVSKKRRITIPIPEEDTPLIKLEEVDSKPIDAPVPEGVSQKFALTTPDKWLTASHLFQWGLIGATTYCGLAPVVASTLGIIAGVGVEFANYCMLPEDASLLRKAMTLPVVSKAVLSFNPVINGISRAYSLLSSVQTSVRKLSNAWEGLKSDPVNAAKAGTIHLFNLASGIAFAADSAGLVKLRPEPPPPKCPPKAKANLPCSNCGMFCIALYLLGVLDRQRSGKYSGVKVDFEKNGLYYDAKYDETHNGNKGNWFENYFNPVDYQDPNCPDAPETTPDFFDNATYADANQHYKDIGLPKERAKTLIEQHLVLKPEIQLEIDQFTQNNFSENDYVLGVHYRGTDKVTAYAPTGIAIEARPVSYQEMTSKIQEQIDGLKPTDQARVKIFAASDEEGFIKHIKTAFPGRVVPSPSERSTNGAPLHFKSKDNPNYSPYKIGKEALIDSWLLGKLSKILIRTSSNLGKFASFLLRDGAEEVQVSKRIHEDPIRTPA